MSAWRHLPENTLLYDKCCAQSVNSGPIIQLERKSALPSSNRDVSNRFVNKLNSNAPIIGCGSAKDAVGTLSRPRQRKEGIDRRRTVYVINRAFELAA